MSLVVTYDSGVGGLSIHQSINQCCTNYNTVFVSDNEAFPYGTKPESELVERVTKVVTRIDQRYAPDILVVACNTASTVVLPILRERFKFEVVGVVPAIKPAARLSDSKHIGLLATPATVGRAYTDRLIDEFAGHCVLTKVGSSELVSIAEDKLSGRAVVQADISAILAPFIQDTRIDTVVLACTHFPLLRQEINEVFEANSRSVTLIDSGDGIARRVCSLLPSETFTVVPAEAVFTQALDKPALFKKLDEMGFSSIDILKI